MSRYVRFSGARPDLLTVKATGPTCARARIIVTIRTATHRRIWNEEAYISLVERGDFPPKGDPDITLEHVTGEVENWISYENTAEAPVWPGTSSRETKPSPTAAPQYETKLDRRRYERIRATRSSMLCIPIGPESAHCIAVDPSTKEPVEFFGRGI